MRQLKRIGAVGGTLNRKSNAGGDDGREPLIKVTYREGDKVVTKQVKATDWDPEGDPVTFYFGNRDNKVLSVSRALFISAEDPEKIR